MGSTLAPPDPGGVIRRLYLDVNGFRGLGVATAERARGRPLAPRGTDEGTRWIDFTGGTGHLDTIPFADVLRGRFRPELVRGKVAVVGASAPSLQDLHATTTAQEDFMSGPEIQGHQIATALAGFPLGEVGTTVGLLLVVLAACVPAAALALRPALAWAAGLALGALLLVVLQVAFERGDPASGVLDRRVRLRRRGDGRGHVTHRRLERRRLREQFARFVPGHVVDDVLEEAGPSARLGGVERNATVMFCDLRDFTRFAESRAPAEVIEVLNRFLDEMTDAVMAHGGTLTAYMGDGLMAVFGAPLAQDDHADRAVAAARETPGARPS